MMEFLSCKYLLIGLISALYFTSAFCEETVKNEVTSGSIFAHSQNPTSLNYNYNQGANYIPTNKNVGDNYAPATNAENYRLPSNSQYYYQTAQGSFPTGEDLKNSQILYQQQWNRDTYTDAAQQLGISLDSTGTQVQHGGFINAEPEEDRQGLVSGGISGGLGAGLATILGIKGLKGLTLLGTFKAAVPFLLIALPIIIILPALLFFLPIPVITIPATAIRRSIGFSFSDISGKMNRMSLLARSVLESEKCVERISCEMSRIGRGSFIDKTMTRLILRFQRHLPSSVMRVARVYMEHSPSCSKYLCSLANENELYKKTL